MQEQKAHNKELIREAEKLIKDLEREEDELEDMAKDTVLLETVMAKKEESQSNY